MQELLAQAAGGGMFSCGFCEFKTYCSKVESITSSSSSFSSWTFSETCGPCAVDPWVWGKEVGLPGMRLQHSDKVSLTSDHCPLTSDQESFSWITLHRQAGDGSAHERAQEGSHQVQRWLVSRNKWTNPWLTNKSSTFSNCDVFCPRCNFFTFDPEQSLLHAAQHREDEKNRLGPFLKKTSLWQKYF